MPPFATTGFYIRLHPHCLCSFRLFGFMLQKRSSTGTLNHILIRRSMSRSTILRATHCISSECGMESKYFLTNRRRPHLRSLHRVACVLSELPPARFASADSHRHSDRSPLQRSVPVTAWRLFAPPDPVWSEFQVDVHRRRASGSLPAA